MYFKWSLIDKGTIIDATVLVSALETEVSLGYDMHRFCQRSLTLSCVVRVCSIRITHSSHCTDNIKQILETLTSRYFTGHSSDLNFTDHVWETKFSSHIPKKYVMESLYRYTYTMAPEPYWFLTTSCWCCYSSEEESYTLLTRFH